MTPVPAPDSGLIHVNSSYSVTETAKRLEASLLAHGITIFCRVDHSGEAEKAGLHMPPTQLLIFGNPKGGTPLMQDHKAPASIFRLRRWAGRTPTARSG